MSKAVNSPTARLLQSSRLFSLPRPLPPASFSPVESAGVYKASPTATEAYPTHQAIATTAPSFHRGDWGLKRPLPGKKLSGANPTVQVRANDTYEHITDFGSAGAYVQTERKWAEMGVPMVLQPESSSTRERIGVYESWIDNTDPKASGMQADGRNVADNPEQMQRWRHSAPWLAGMQEGEFNAYVKRSIGTTRRRDEWRTFLRNNMWDSRMRRTQAGARERGEPLTSDEMKEARQRLRPTDEEVRTREKELRNEHNRDNLSSDLTRLIAAFLDLPNVVANVETSSGFAQNLLGSLTTSAEKGPPTTHPSAGLSHLRTNAILENHLLYGPQTRRSPIQARVLAPRTNSGEKTMYQAKLGVGGVVAIDNQSATSGPLARGPGGQQERADPTHAYDERVEGGGKIWVHPESAWIDADGRIRLEVTRGEIEAVAVKTGEGLDDIHAAKKASTTPSFSEATQPNNPSATSLYSRRDDAPRAQPRFNGNAPGQSDSQRPAPSSRVKGFDDELRGRRQPSEPPSVEDIGGLFSEQLNQYRK